MSESTLLYLTQVLTTFAFILFAYYLLSYLSKKMNFKEKRPIFAFKIAIIAGVFDLFLTMVVSLANANKLGLYLFFVTVEILAFYFLAKTVYKIKWQYSLSMAFLLLLTLLFAEIAVVIGMVTFISIYASV